MPSSPSEGEQSAIERPSGLAAFLYSSPASVNVPGAAKSTTVVRLFSMSHTGYLWRRTTLRDVFVARPRPPAFHKRYRRRRLNTAIVGRMNKADEEQTSGQRIAHDPPPHLSSPMIALSLAQSFVSMGYRTTDLLTYRNTFRPR
jgi:hypothetical protein